MGYAKNSTHMAYVIMDDYCVWTSASISASQLCWHLSLFQSVSIPIFNHSNPDIGMHFSVGIGVHHHLTEHQHRLNILLVYSHKCQHQNDWRLERTQKCQHRNTWKSEWTQMSASEYCSICKMLASELFSSGWHRAQYPISLLHLRSEWVAYQCHAHIQANIGLWKYTLNMPAAC